MIDLKQLPELSPPVYTGDPQTYALALSHYLSLELRGIKSVLGGSLRWQNLRSNLVSGTTPGTPDTAFTLTHNLGKIPEFYLPNVDTLSAVIHATPTDQAAWTESTITLRCSHASVGVVVLVM